MKIRSAAAGDELTLAALAAFAQPAHAAAHPEHFRAARRRDVGDWFAALLRQPTAAVWIATDDSGAGVGYVTAQFHEQPDSPFAFARRWCEIDQLVVAPAHRRRGVARALVEAVVDDARANGVRDVEVSVWSFNDNAQAMFRRLGFSPRALCLRRPVSPPTEDGPR